MSSSFCAVEATASADELRTAPARRDHRVQRVEGVRAAARRHTGVEEQVHELPEEVVRHERRLLGRVVVAAVARREGDDVAGGGCRVVGEGDVDRPVDDRAAVGDDHADVARTGRGHAHGRRQRPLADDDRVEELDGHVAGVGERPTGARHEQPPAVIERGRQLARRGHEGGGRLVARGAGHGVRPYSRPVDPPFCVTGQSPRTDPVTQSVQAQGRSPPKGPVSARHWARHSGAGQGSIV